MSLISFLQQHYMTTFVILIIFLKDSNLQIISTLPGILMKVPRRVTVQHNLCVDIPCTFQISQLFSISRNIKAIWLKGGQLKMDIVAWKNSERDFQDKYSRFVLTGDVGKGDCSLRISDAKYEDASSYTFRIEDTGVQLSFADVNTRVTVLNLTDTPEISPISTLIAGERVTLTCTSPGRCAGKAPQITWEGTFMRSSVHQYTISHDDGTRTYSSNLTFTPSIKDSLRKLGCIVTFADSLTSRSEIELEVEDPDTKDNPSQVRPIDIKFIAGIIVGNILILLLIGIGLIYFIKGHMKRALTGNRPDSSKSHESETAYQELTGQSNHTYDNIVMK